MERSEIRGLNPSARRNPSRVLRHRRSRLAV